MVIDDIGPKFPIELMIEASGRDSGLWPPGGWSDTAFTRLYWG